MCGIAGLVASNDVARRELLVAMRDAMRHRGPDDQGTWWSRDGLIGLAHRRLAILDLSPAGRQPMCDQQGDLCIVFNGEIYNHRELRALLEHRGHRFRSSTDTEVLLASYREWGEDCLSRLQGMWAFAIYDARVRRLFVARDRAGERPLFYAQNGRSLAFASELKALFADPARERSVDLAAFASYLAYGYVPHDRCMITGVRKLPAGHALSYDVDTAALAITRYWTLPTPTGDTAAPSVDALADELEDLLADAVKRQLVADVPVGVLLSGGVDSSLITAMAARSSGAAVRTFTIRFPGAGSYDEGPFARAVADHFGTTHTELVAEPATVDLLPRLARQFDDPIADSSMVPTYLVSKLIRTAATVALGGDGGDELFGGYPHYSWLSHLERVRPFVPSVARTLVAHGAGRLAPGVRGRNHLLGVADRSAGVAHVNLYFDRAWRERLCPALKEVAGPSPECLRGALCADRYTALQQATATDFLTTMVDGYLVKVDRASMLNSLEVRAPFLDHRIVEFAFARVPDAAKVCGRERKIIARRLAARLLPGALDLRRKQGFSMPLDQWFKGEWGRFVTEVLKEADPHIFAPRAVAALLDGQRRGRANTGRLFSLAMFELWRREYRVTVPA